MNPIGASPLQRPILWLPACALAAVYAMFTLSWMVYRVHLPAQMQALGFAASAAPLLLLVEALLSIAVEPLAGAWSDRTNRQQGSRFPLITLGIVLSSLLFVAIPALGGVTTPDSGLRWGVLGLLLAWSVTMSLFRSPALALLRRYAPNAQLPQVASLLTFAVGLAGAATPLASPFVLNLGPALSFTLVAVLLLISAMWLRWLNPISLAASEPAEYFHSTQRVSGINLALIFGMGMGITLAFRLAIETFPKILKAQIPGIHPPTFVGLVFISLAIAALPIGPFAVRQGNSRALLKGLSIAVLALGLMLLSRSVPIAFMSAIALGIAFSLITNGTLPFAIEQVPSNQAGLGIGTLFAGAAAASSLFLAVLGKQPIPIAIGVAVLGLVVAGLCVAQGRLGR